MSEQPRQDFLVIGRALGARLYLDDLALAGKDEIAVGFGVRILVIVEVEHRRAPEDAARDRRHLVRDRVFRNRLAGERSEEHTSELQSLMRISYAVFCLKKKNNKADIHEYV